MPRKTFRRVHCIRTREASIAANGSLKVIGLAFLVNGHAKVVVECSCGTCVVLDEANLRRQFTCGYCRRQILPSGTRETLTFKTWSKMRERCRNPQNKYYHGRGIKVHEPWIKSFEQFVVDAGERPSDEHTLDRYPDKYGNYEPGNVRWATKEEQMNNCTNNVNLTLYGKTMSVAQWSRVSGILHNTIRLRIRSGWPAKAAVFSPVGMKRKEIELIIGQKIPKMTH